MLASCQGGDCTAPLAANKESTMNNKEGPSARDLEAGVKPRSQRKPYRKPEFLHERVFETTALACGKINTSQGQCHWNHRTS
jgi:hypothetical protein